MSTRSYHAGHVKPHAAAIGTNSRRERALPILPTGYVRCPVCTNKARPHPNKPGQLRVHRDLFSHPCYNRDLEATA